MTKGKGKQELCGGLGYINVYNNTDPTFKAFGSNQNTAGNAQPYTPPAGFAENYLGCYSDNSGGHRTLSGPNIAQQNMTLEICAAFCASGPGYQYYATEYATQCFCGNTISSSAMLLTPTTTPTNTSACQTRCQGAEPEICGGSNALSMYNATDFQPPVAKSPIDGYEAIGCLTDPNTQGRGLQGASTVDYDNMTEETCVDYCAGKGFSYAG